MMKYVKYIIIFITTTIMLLSSSCFSTKRCERCKIEKVSTIVVKSDNSYSMQVRFNRCNSKYMRENLVRNELINRYPSIENKTICIDEYLGKRYNEYRYEISIKVE